MILRKVARQEAQERNGSDRDGDGDGDDPDDNGLPPTDGDDPERDHGQRREAQVG